MSKRSSICLLLIAMLMPGCGYTSGTASNGYHWSSLYRQDVRTIAVPIFTSKVYQRGVEFSLSKALVNEIEAKTPYKVVPRERADTILEGEILDVQVNTLSEDIHAAIPQEQLLDIHVNFTWKDLRTGRILCNRTDWEQASTYYATLGEGRATGTQIAVEKLAGAIVGQLQGDW